MSDRDAAIRQIHRYIKLPDCKYTGSFRHSEEVAISRWAAMEIAKNIAAHPNVPFRDIIGEFYGKMVRCMQLSRQSKQKNLFKIAANAADEINAMF